MKRLISATGTERPAARRRGVRGGPGARSPRLIALAIVLLLVLAILAPAGQASEGQEEGLATPINLASHQAIRAAEKANRAALKAAQRAADQQRRAAERKARREAREGAKHAPKERKGNFVTVDCTKVTVAYHGFHAVEGSPNKVVEWIRIRKPPESISKETIVFPPIVFSFAGTEATDVERIAFPVGHYMIDVHAIWFTNGNKSHFDIQGRLTCSPAPAYTVRKLQSIVGSGQAPTAETLTGKVGQIIDYRITVANTGNTPLTFSGLKDSRCDPGTIAGGSLSPVEPTETLTFTCTHTLTSADQTAGFYMNVATVTASPEEGEGATITSESNAVVVTPVGPGAKGKEDKPEEGPVQKTEETKPKSEVPGTTSSSTGTGTTTSEGGVLGFTSATVPALKGPQGCVRSGFVASIRANGVSSVIFYLDGHRLGRLTYRNAHKGMLSIRINPAKLKVGAHHLLARITMKQSSPSAKAARASRQLTVIRCKSALLTPHFTG